MQEALCTMPATRKAAAAPAATTCATPPPCRRLCVLRLPRERQPRPQWRPRTPQLLQEALCTAPACHVKGSRGPAAHARRSSSRRLCVLHLPRKRQPRASGAHARRAPPGGSVYCACHAGSCGPAAPTRAAAPPGSVYCACHAKGSRRQRRPPAPQLRQEALCTAPATQKAAAGQRRPRGPATPTRAAAPPGGSAWVLRLPRKRQPPASSHAKGSRRPAAPTCAAAPPGGSPATKKAAAGHRRPRAPGGSVYCACE